MTNSETYARVSEALYRFERTLQKMGYAPLDGRNRLEQLEDFRNTAREIRALDAAQAFGKAARQNG